MIQRLSNDELVPTGSTPAAQFDVGQMRALILLVKATGICFTSRHG